MTTIRLNPDGSLDIPKEWISPPPLREEKPRIRLVQVRRRLTRKNEGGPLHFVCTNGPTAAEKYGVIPDEPDERALLGMLFWFDPRKYSDKRAAQILVDGLLRMTKEGVAELENLRKEVE